MKRLTSRLRSLAFVLLSGLLTSAWAGIVVIGHANVRKLDLPTVQRIYTGKVIEVGGVPVAPVNLHVGQPARQRFLSDYMQQNEDAYLAYWTVRRYVGKGVPPREMANVADIIQYVQNTPGAVAYLDEADVPTSMNVLLRK